MRLWTGDQRFQSCHFCQLGGGTFCPHCSAVKFARRQSPKALFHCRPRLSWGRCYKILACSDRRFSQRVRGELSDPCLSCCWAWMPRRAAATCPSPPSPPTCNPKLSKRRIGAGNTRAVAGWLSPNHSGRALYQSLLPQLEGRNLATVTLSPFTSFETLEQSLRTTLTYDRQTSASGNTLALACHFIPRA
jgi:hypothetical protein